MNLPAMVAVTGRNVMRETSNDMVLIGNESQSCWETSLGAVFSSITSPTPLPAPINVPATFLMGDGSWEVQMGAR